MNIDQDSNSSISISSYSHPIGKKFIKMRLILKMNMMSLLQVQVPPDYRMQQKQQRMAPK